MQGTDYTSETMPAASGKKIIERSRCEEAKRRGSSGERRVGSLNKR
jgi:hypothetical protein